MIRILINIHEIRIGHQLPADPKDAIGLQLILFRRIREINRLEQIFDLIVGVMEAG
jgi:hypothetical protein